MSDLLDELQRVQSARDQVDAARVPTREGHCALIVAAEKIAAGYVTERTRAEELQRRVDALEGGQGLLRLGLANDAGESVAASRVAEAATRALAARDFQQTTQPTNT